MTSKKVLGIFSLAMINVAAIISLRNLPIMAEYGFASVFFYTLAACLYLIPTGLVAAELATGWPEKGGLYVWVTEGLGPNIGFLAIWLAWIESIAWFPAILSFIGVTIAYIFNPALASNHYFMSGIILVTFWLATVVNFFGMKTSRWISSLGVISGTLFPGALVIGLGAWWFFSGKPMQIDFNAHSFFPEFKLSNIVFFSGVLLGFAGMELVAFHATEAKNPQRDYPIAMCIAAIIILTVSVLGSLAIAIVVPKDSIGLVEGIMQAFTAFFKATGMSWIVPVIAILAVVGPCAGLNTWIVGPVKGLLPAGEAGFLPKALTKQNAEGVPVALLVLQATIGSALSLVFLLVPNVDTAYWIVTAVSAQFALVMFGMIFISAIRLRYTQPDKVRGYKIPGGNFGMWLVAGIGLLTCIGTFLISFIPPDSLDTSMVSYYESSMVAVFVLLTLPAVYFCKTRRDVASNVF